jgi:hypothetical protein
MVAATSSRTSETPEPAELLADPHVLQFDAQQFARSFNLRVCVYAHEARGKRGIRVDKQREGHSNKKDSKEGKQAECQ